jgi:Tat protein secretion system quality control protein TatD with DNase activity
VIPGFGIHPWWSHLHGSGVGSTWEELLEGPSPDEVARAIGILTAARDAQRQGDAAALYQQVRQQGGTQRGEEEGGSEDERPQQSQPEAAAASGPTSSSTITPTTTSTTTSSSTSGGGGGGPLDIVPHAAWRSRLRALLAAHPNALVGEVGVDRAAVIPGSKARVRFDHQVALLAEQLALAAEFGRPVSCHCVRGYGHLLTMFQDLARGGGGSGLPPAVMLHSYGGSPEEVARFCLVPALGPRLFFSFSSAINGRTPEKLAARIRAVPDDRLLVESDQVGWWAGV